MVRVLTKQQQMIEIELGEYKLSKTFDHPAIHPEAYYAKLAWTWKFLDVSVKLLKTNNKEIENEIPQRLAH